MHDRKLMVFALGLVTLGLIGSIPLVSAGTPKEPSLVRIGMAKSFFHDIPKVLIDLAAEPFKSIMKTTTDLDGELNTEFEPFVVAQKVMDNQLELGVFHGHEFAWVQQKYPQLRPLMIAVNKHRDVRAFLIVKKDNPVIKVSELRGKDLAMPFATKEHCRVYLKRYCTDNAQCDPKAFFGSIVTSGSAEEALDNVCLGKVQATVVDTIGLEFYKRIKEPCFNNNLRILQQSEAFPPAVIVYKQGVLSEKTLTQVRDGLQRAHTTEAGKDIMFMWKIAGFEGVHANFSQSLTDVIKAYPAP
jgi:ABC-type phosphate/phosphonate transport system substrate-binding protein